MGLVKKVYLFLLLHDFLLVFWFPPFSKNKHILKYQFFWEWWIRNRFVYVMPVGCYLFY